MKYQSHWLDATTPAIQHVQTVLLVLLAAFGFWSADDTVRRSDDCVRGARFSAPGQSGLVPGEYPVNVAEQGRRDSRLGEISQQIVPLRAPGDLARRASGA